MWSYKVWIFDSPRPGPQSLHHEVIPEGQSADEFRNQDFCFYDVIEVALTPEVVRKR